jgi:hypothetical protein
MKSLRLVLLVLCVSTVAFGSDREFREVVRSIEHTYGVHHMHIPLLGVAMFFSRPEGVSGLHLAVFEGFDTPALTEDVSRVIENSLGEGWYPFVRVRSGDNGETTLIYANPSGGKMRMMIVNLEPTEATVVEFKLDEGAVKSWLKEPGENAEGEAGHRHHFD